MALSFQESIQEAESSSAAETTTVSASNDIAVTSLEEDTIAVQSDEDGWTRSDSYLWYDKYKDDNISKIDDNKNITVDSSQINLTQESNSQYIPFEMPRYYDGIDLMDMSLLIHFVNKNKDEDNAVPVNVSYSKDKIRFAWLCDKRVTAISGEISFELRAIGVNEKGDEYIWISKPNGKLNISASLAGNGIIQPSQDWTSSFITQMNEKIAQAQSAAQDAQNSVANVQSAVDQALEAAIQAQDVVDNAKTELEDDISDTIGEFLANYYTKDEVDLLLEDIDLTDVYDKINSIDGLKEFKPTYDSDTYTLSFYNGDTLIDSFVLNTNPTAEWVSAYDAKVDSKISAKTASIESDLETYKGEVADDLKEIHDTIDDLPETLATDYYTKEATDELLDEKADKTTVSGFDTRISAVEATANTNKSNIATHSTKLEELENSINNIDTTPSLAYDVAYNSDNEFIFYEIEKEGTEDEVRREKQKFVIQGGGGGTTTTSSLKIEYVTKSPLIVTTNDQALITFNFSGTDSSGDEVTDGTATWKIGNTIISTSTVVSGENTFDATSYISLGTQKLVLSITDDAGSLVTKSWNVQKIDVRIESTFDDTLTYPIGDISFDYTPYGAIAKTVHFILDGQELGTVTTSTSGIPISYTLSAQTHGSHLLEVYLTAELNGSTIESNHIVKDIIWYDSSSDVPVISCSQQEITAMQYDASNIVYTVYDPKTETPRVTIAVDGTTVSTLVLDSNTQTWQYKTSDIGKHILTITCGDTVKTLKVTVEKLDIDLEPVTAGLVFDFNPTGKSNSDEDRLWSDGDVSMTVSDNFDWVNGGYQIDDNGDQYFGIKAGTSAVIDYQMFADDAKRNGKEFKLVFKTTNVRRADATFLTCLDGTTSQIGLQMNVHEAYIEASADSLYLPYSEEDIIEFEFNITKNTDTHLVSGFEDGVGTRSLIYGDSHNFTQNNPQNITIGSPDCDVLIYRMKVYSSSLTDKGILNNFIADARNAEEMIDRYTRNQIYDENNLLNPDTLAEKCPWLRVYTLEAPHFTNNKSDKVTGTTIRQIYKNGDTILDNWTALNSGHNGQGTTSNEYGAAGRNLEFVMNYSDTKIILGDGVTEAENGKITLTRTSVPTNYLNFKINVASSESANNALGQKRYNRYLPYTMPAQRRDSRVKNDMEFFNCVVFIKESDPDISTHREFDDCDFHFYGLGNIGDSKKTDNTRVNNAKDPKEFCVEIMDNTLPNSTFQTGEQALADLDADEFDENGTYGWRYEMKGITTEQRQANIKVWRDFYRFVVNSSDDDFKAHLSDWFIVDSALYFYLFTERYTMIDNRAKNTFWHFSKVYISQDEASSLGDEAEYYTIDDAAVAINDGYRFEFWDYDNDTLGGINNSGELTLTYGKEDVDFRTDGDPNSGYVFNAATSTFFCRIRDLFTSELNTMFSDRESEGAWSATSFINEFDDWQNEFPEELWRLHYERLYFRTYKNGVERFLREMMNGRKKYQRRQFERDQEMYMASKHYGTTATSDNIMFRCNTPTQAVVTPDYTLHLTPYSDMYLSVMFGATYRTQVRAKAGQQYDIACPFSTMDDTAVLIYGASNIQAIGDISRCYIHDNDFSNATRLQELIIGNTTTGYQNTFLTTLGIGNNALLKKLDIQSTPNLAQALDVSSCGNLEELYAYGSGLTGVTFANGGKIRIAQLPAIGAITMRNLAYLTGLELASLEKLTTLIVENCNTVDILDFLKNAPNINRVRITGIEWNLDDTELLDSIYAMTGIDKNGYNIAQSVLSGSVHVPVMREQKLADFNTAWTDLDITYDTLIAQFAVTFVNDDGTILDVQYVDKGESAVDPITRETNPIPTPAKASTVSTDFTYNGWDLGFTGIFANRTITATYSETVRQYTVRFLNIDNTVLQTTTAPYGTSVEYTGDIPTYTKQESAFVYYLFKGWQTYPLVTGNIDILAEYDVYNYDVAEISQMSISDMTPVQIYAMLANKDKETGDLPAVVNTKDSISFTMGEEFNYSNMTCTELFPDGQRLFTGVKGDYYDTGIALLDEDKDWVLAVDYQWESSSNNAVLMQCYQSISSDGFRMRYYSGYNLNWGSSSQTTSSADVRDMLVLRHVKGETILHVYLGNQPNAEIIYTEMDATRATTSNGATLIFGAARSDDGILGSYAQGSIYSARLFDYDIGDTACRQMALWTRETITAEVDGFRRYYLSDNSGARCTISFLMSHLLENKMSVFNSSNVGGYGATNTHKILQSRFYQAIPTEWRQLFKQCKVGYNTGYYGSGSTESGATVEYADAYVTLPSILEVDSSFSRSPYEKEAGEPDESGNYNIDYILTRADRARAYADGTNGRYITRSAMPQYSYTWWSIAGDGDDYSSAGANDCWNSQGNIGICLEFSF